MTERGEPAASARDTLQDFWANGWVDFTPITVERIGGEEAFRYRAALPGGGLTEWKFAHRGWLYAVGALNRAPDEGMTVERARKTLDTWQWLDSAG